jgi:dolichol-phosphate mannosyltransferase
LDISSYDRPSTYEPSSATSGVTLKLNVVVPCFNEEKVIDEFYRRMSSACQSCVGSDYEIILVNDGSSDRTWNIMLDLVERHPNVTVVSLSRNYGHQLALSAGLTLCSAERILMIDADLQDPPELLGDMMHIMDQGSDVVYGLRQQRKGEKVVKRITATAFYRILARLTEKTIPIDTGDFRLINRRVLDALLTMPEQHRFIRGMVAWLGFHQAPCPYVREPRFAGTTKYPLRKMLNFASDAITSFSTVPLRFSMVLSSAFMVIALILSIYVMVSWLFFDTVRGWSSLTLIVIVFSSVQLLCIGILGEYIGRIYTQVKNRPLFLIDQIVTSKKGNLKR